MIEFLSQSRHHPAWVRVNAGARGLDDARALSGAKALDGIWVAKAEDPGLVDEIGAVSRVSVGPLIESARGVLAMPDLLAVRGVVAVQLREIDLAADLHLCHVAPGSLDWFRHWLVLNAAAADVPGRRRLPRRRRLPCVVRRAAGHGLRCQSCIHPAQVEISDEVFGVSEEELAAAHRLVDTYEAALREGRGAYGDHGVMVVAATIRQARQLTGRP